MILITNNKSSNNNSKEVNQHDNNNKENKSISRHFTLNKTKDRDIIEYLQNNANVSKYIKDLIRNDIEKNNESTKNKRSEIRKEVDQYARTKMFRDVIVEGLKDYETMQFFEDYIEKKIEKMLVRNMDKIASKTIEKANKK